MLLDQDKAISDAREVEALQRYMRKFGCYNGDYTKQAVEDLHGAVAT